MPAEIHIDVLIFGGGIAGLWTLARLRKEGYSCLLLESRALGAGQTIASQGIIHGGVKYSLTGQASPASKAIAEMPAIWRACLRGEGETDLRTATVLNEHQYLWSATGLLGRLVNLGASISMRADVRRAEGDERPALLHDTSGTDVYRVDEPVLDCRSVVGALAASAPGCCFSYPGADHLLFEPPVEWHTFRAIDLLDRPGGESVLRIVPGFTLFAAGAGNADLLHAAHQTPGFAIQRRPLHMVMVRGVPGPLFGHCTTTSTLPRLTITSSPPTPGRPDWVWYIGGAIAEGGGVARSPADQIEFARRELRECLPAANLSGARFATLRIDRSEAVPKARNPPQRPDEPFVLGARSHAVAWPTKLAFAPVVAAQVLEQVHRDRVPQTGGSAPNLSTIGLSPATIAPFPWDREDLAWN